MAKFLKVLLVSGALVALTASAAWADSPHFIGTPTATLSGNSLNISASVAGLGTADNAEFSLDGTVNVFSRCYNKGGNKPQADNKQETINVSQDQSFPVRNGRTNISFTVTPLSSLTCPGNQVVVIESVSYNLTLSGEGLTYTFTSA
jgi:hypothetical protein